MIPMIPTSSAIPTLMPVAGLAALLGPAALLALGGVLAALLVLIVDTARAPQTAGRLPRDVPRGARVRRELEPSVRHAA